jgi:phytoene synthase
MPVSHYENFPVASLLLPRRLRRPVEAIYWFARSADDLADEGDHPPDWRLAALDGYRRELDRIEAGAMAAAGPWRELAGQIAEFGLPVDELRHLLDAFAQDVTCTRYEDYAALEHYCRRSANPVGRLMLHLFGALTPQNLRDSDAICTSLQLLNFCQDVAMDWSKNRIYFPLDELRACGVTGRHFDEGIADDSWRRLFDRQLGRARRMLRSGGGLPGRLNGRPALELRAIVAAGERIGGLLAATGGDVFRHRPVLGRRDWALVLMHAFLPWTAGANGHDALPSSAR